MDRICHACVTNMGPFSALLHRGCLIDFTIQRQASFAWVAPSAPARSTDSTARQVRDAGSSRHSTSTPLPLWPEYHNCVWTDLRLNNGGLPSLLTRPKPLDIDQEKKEVAK